MLSGVNIQVPVPSDMVGMIIGKQGENIRRIQMDTNTKIQFAEGLLQHGIVYQWILFDSLD